MPETIMPLAYGKFNIMLDNKSQLGYYFLLNNPILLIDSYFNFIESGILKLKIWIWILDCQKLLESLCLICILLTSSDGTR